MAIVNINIPELSFDGTNNPPHKHVNNQIFV